MENEYIEITKLEERQKLLVALLERFHAICQENGLVYNIFGGTLLGAVRHQGIIPWDDDVDVTMPRADYNKFIEVVRKKYSDQFVAHAYPDDYYIYPFVKFGMRGTVLYESLVKAPFNKLTLNMDVFPNDSYPADESVIDVCEKCERSIISLTYNFPKRRNPIIRLRNEIKNFVGRCRGVKHYLKKQIDLLSALNDESSDFMVCPSSGFGRKGRLKRCIYYDRILYRFSEIEVWGIRNYHDHLTNLYGDYMTPPPPEKRQCPHSSRLLVSDDIFKRYLAP